jgi:hypothetical protein
VYSNTHGNFVGKLVAFSVFQDGVLPNGGLDDVLRVLAARHNKASVQPCNLEVLSQAKQHFDSWKLQLIAND